MCKEEAVAYENLVSLVNSLVEIRTYTFLNTIQKPYGLSQIHTHIHVRIHTQKLTYTNIHACSPTHTHKRTYTKSHTLKYTYTKKHIHKKTHTQKNTFQGLVCITLDLERTGQTLHNIQEMNTES